MGRFYKTTEGQQLDYMSKLPIDLMLKGLQQSEQGTDEVYNTTDLIGNSLTKVNHLTSDDARVKLIQDEYNKRIEEVTNDLASDPTNYRKKMPLVRALTKDLTNDMTSGELAAIQGNYSRLNEWDKTYKPLVGAKDGITPDAYRRMRSAFISQFDKNGGTGYDNQTGNYNQLAVEDAYRTQDFAKILKDKIGTIKANAHSYKQDSEGGKWIVTNGGKTEEVSEARVAVMALDALKSDPNVMGYIKQGGKYGYLNGVYGEDGNFIEPVSFDKRGNPVFNHNSILTAPIHGLVTQEAYRKSETERGLKENGFTKQSIQFGMDMAKKQADNVYRDEDKKQDAALKFQYDVKGMKIKQDNAKELIQLRADLAAGKITPDQAKKAADKLNTVTAPKITKSGDGAMAVSIFGGERRVTPENIHNEIETLQDEAHDLLSLSKNPDISQNERSIYLKNYSDKMAQLNQSSDVADKARNFTLSKLKTEKGYSDEDIKKIDRIGSIKSSLEKSIDNVNKQLTMPFNGGANSFGVPLDSSTIGKTQELTKQKASLERTLNKYKKLERDYNGLTSKWFEDNQDKATTKIDGIGLDVPEKKVIYQNLKSNIDQFIIHDLNTDNKDPNFKAEYNSTYAEWFKGKNPEDVIDVQTINSPVPGLGATLTFKFKGDYGVATNDKQFMMSIPSKIQAGIASKVAQYKDNPKASKIGNLLMSEEKTRFRTAIDTSIPDYTGTNRNQPASYYSHYDDTHGVTVNLKVVPVSNQANKEAAPVSYKTYLVVNGKETPLELPIKLGDGRIGRTSEFADKDDIVNGWFDYIHPKK